MDPQNNIDEFRKEVFQLVSKNEIPEAIGRLIELYKSPEGTYYDDLLLLSRQFKDLTDRQLSGLVKDEDANLEKNRITHALINIVSNLHSDPVAARHFGIAPPIDKKAGQPTERRKLPAWIWVFPFALVIVIASIFFIRNRNKTDGKAMPEVTQLETPETNHLPDGENVQPKTNVAEPSPPSGPEMSAHSSPKNAKTLPSGQMITETLLSRKDVHYYKFLATSDGRVDFKLMNLTPTYSPAVSILNPDGNRLIGTTARRGDNIITWFRAKKGAQYRIQIGIRNSDPGKYKLGVGYQ